jgi:membrane fusion protein, multidrug efflux system
VGEWAGEGWIITAGLKAGERVIIDGVLKLGPGAPVKVAEGKAAQPGEAAPAKPAGGESAQAKDAAKGKK